MSEDNVTEEDGALDEPESEKQDSESEPAEFDIFTYPADFTLQGFVEKYRRRTLIVPRYQRRFVWNIKQSSLLIESFLRGLPVPPVYLYANENNEQLVVDGQQRLLSIVYFFDGYFDPKQGDKRRVFSLTGLNERSPYSGRTYEDLKDTDEAAYNKLNDAVLRAFIIKQLDPKDDSSVYEVFKRLNTGGTQLAGQEIRNCIYHGPFNDLLIEMNSSNAWRRVFGKLSQDRRQRDVELILRFLALHYESDIYAKPMKIFLNNFMKRHKDVSDSKLPEMKDTFERTTESVLEHLGDKPFEIRTGLNASVFDCVYVAFAAHLEDMPNDIAARFAALKADEFFRGLATQWTTDAEAVRKRLKLANDRLFG